MPVTFWPCFSGFIFLSTPVVWLSPQLSTGSGLGQDIVCLRHLTTQRRLHTVIGHSSRYQYYAIYKRILMLMRPTRLEKPLVSLMRHSVQCEYILITNRFFMVDSIHKYRNKILIYYNWKLLLQMCYNMGRMWFRWCKELRHNAADIG